MQSGNALNQAPLALLGLRRMVIAKDVSTVLDMQDLSVSDHLEGKTIYTELQRLPFAIQTPVGHDLSLRAVQGGVLVANIRPRRILCSFLGGSTALSWPTY